MKKIDLGQGITILANIGVILGIAFLAVELRQNNEWLASESRYSRSFARSAWHETLATDEYLIEIITKAQQGDALSSSEELRLRNLYMNLFAQWEWEFQEYSLGRIEISFEGYRESFGNEPGSDVPVYPRLRETWDQFKVTYGREFQRFMDEQIVN